jgi:small-conductance mechanosensitive channel
MIPNKIGIELERVSRNHLRVPERQVSIVDSQCGSGSDQTDGLLAQTESMSSNIAQVLSTVDFHNLEEMIAAADQLEQENFSLYTCVVESGAANAGIRDELERMQQRRQELERLAEMSDEEQAAHLAELTTQITAASKDLSESRSVYESEIGEFREVYDRLTDLFNSSGCSWQNAPDEKTTVSQTNVMFVLSEIEKRLMAVMDDVYEQANIQFEAIGQDVKVSETEHDTSAMKGYSPLTREISTKQIENSRPLTIEEIQSLL